jgi:hypothetical protein
MSIIQNEPKKRGRKPKSASIYENDGRTIVSDSIEQNSPVIIIDDNTPKKRGRKPKSVNDYKPSINENKQFEIKHTKKLAGLDNIIVVNKLSENSEELTESKKNIIVHLPINVDNITNIIEDTNISTISELNYENNTWESSIENSQDDINKKYENLLQSRKNDFDISKTKTVSIRKPADYTMSQFMECNKKKTWPQKTNIYCFNCCHSFDHTPAALPFKYQNGIFHVYGNFCYPECAAAFNFTDILSVQNANENYNLLNMMYKIAYNDPFYRVKIPGHRTCLKIFGGHQDIIDYRASFNNEYVTHNIVMPPVMSILPIQEENNIIYYKKNVQASINNSKGYDGANKREKEITLKRSKPLINKQNTLDSCMNITVDVGA